MLFRKRQVKPVLKKWVMKEDVQSLYNRLGYTAPEIQDGDAVAYHLVKIVDMLISHIEDLNQELNSRGFNGD